MEAKAGHADPWPMRHRIGRLVRTAAAVRTDSQSTAGIILTKFWSSVSPAEQRSRFAEHAPRTVRGEEQTVDEAKQAQHGRGVTGHVSVETTPHQGQATVAAQASRRRHSRCRLDAMLWQCPLSATTRVVISGLLRYRPASARGSGDTSTAP